MLWIDWVAHNHFNMGDYQNSFLTQISLSCFPVKEAKNQSKKDIENICWVWKWDQIGNLISKKGWNQPFSAASSKDTTDRSPIILNKLI